MAQLIVNHGVSGCFGTTLAPDLSALKANAAGGT